MAPNEISDEPLQSQNVLTPWSKHVRFASHSSARKTFPRVGRAISDEQPLYMEVHTSLKDTKD